MKTKTTAKKPARKSAPQSVPAAAPAAALPLLRVEISPTHANFYGPDGAHLDRLRNGAAGSHDALVLSDTLATLRKSHGVAISHV